MGLKKWLGKKRSKGIVKTRERLNERLHSPYRKPDGSYDYWVYDKRGKKLYYDWDAATSDIVKGGAELKKQRELELNKKRDKIKAERNKALDDMNSIVNFITFVGGIVFRNHPAGQIITGIKLFKPIVNMIFGRRSKGMKLDQLTHLSQDTGEVLLLICELGNGLGAAAEDGKISLTDAVHLTGAVKALPAAVSGAAKFSLDTDAERDEAIAFVKANFDIPQDKIESMIETGLVAIEKLVEVIKLFKK